MKRAERKQALVLYGSSPETDTGRVFLARRTAFDAMTSVTQDMDLKLWYCGKAVVFALFSEGRESAANRSLRIRDRLHARPDHTEPRSSRLFVRAACLIGGRCTLVGCGICQSSAGPRSVRQKRCHAEQGIRPRLNWVLDFSPILHRHNEFCGRNTTTVLDIPMRAFHRLFCALHFATLYTHADLRLNSGRLH